MFDLTSGTVLCNYLFQSVEYAKLLDEIERIQKYLKKKQAKITGEIDGVYTDLSSGGMKTGKTKIYANEPTKYIDCEFRITAINCKNKNDEDEKELEKESYDDDGKVELFKQFIETEKREPLENDVIKCFKIGKYWKKLKINSMYFNNLQSILQKFIPESQD
jgi:hypothetical protein